MTIRIGTGLPTELAGKGDSVAAAARAAEGRGLESLWAADVLLGDGTPAHEPLLMLAAAAGATERIKIGTSVLSVPTRPLPWLATHTTTMQHLSADRFLLGLGIGGFPGAPFWQHLGVPSRGRGRLLDVALETLPKLVKGEPVVLEPEKGPLQIAPPATMPPVLVGGSEIAFDRIVAYGAEWFPSLMSPQDLAPAVRRLRELADEQQKPRPRVTVGGHLVIGDDARARATYDALVDNLVNLHHLPPDVAARAPMRAREPEELAQLFAEYEAAGADRVVTGADNAGFYEQLDFLAEAVSFLAL